MLSIKLIMNFYVTGGAKTDKVSSALIVTVVRDMVKVFGERIVTVSAYPFLFLEYLKS